MMTLTIKAMMGSLKSLLNLNYSNMTTTLNNVALWNNPKNDGVWRAWVMSKEKALNVEYAIAFINGEHKAYLVNDSYRIIREHGMNHQDEMLYSANDTVKLQQREVFDLTEITDSRLGKRLIAKFKDHSFGQNPVNYGDF